MSEDVTIRELDPQTVERIAAGEVVERPASVVKELVENSLDADASRVEVAVESGGKDGIRVTDDGVGMTEAAVRRAVEKHTTSKIADIDDLASGVATLGFRGEALHAIGAVSRLTIETRPRDGDQGTKLVVEGGEVTSVQPTGCPEGTTIRVDDLFYNVPARRKYLKQDGTEFAHVNDVVTAYALANPDIAVSLEHDGRETFGTTGQGNRQAAIMAVYGREVAESMVDVEGEDLPDGPLASVSGLVSHPETNRASNEYVTTYVNGRYVRSGTVRDAIVDAYGTQLAPDRYPFAVLFVELPGDQVDVNVHPRKMEVRFADGEGVREQVLAAVESALLREGLVRSSAPRGQSAPEQTEIAPGGDGEGEADGDGDEAVGAEATESDAAETGPGTDPTDGPPGETPADETAGETPADAPAGDEQRRVGEQGEQPPEPPTREESPIGPDDIRDADGTASAEGRETGETATADRPADDTETTAQAGDTGTEPRGNDETTAGGSANEGGTADPHARRERQGRFRPGTEQARLGEDGPVEGDDPAEAFERLPSMRVLGQYDDTYLVAETDEGLVLIDQHAADERINYERLRERFADETATQALADPVALDLTAREAALFDQYEDALARLGFRAERTDDRTVSVRTVPQLVAETAGPELIREVLSAFVTGESSAAATVEAAADDLLADLACYPSITGNTSLTEGSALSLLRELDDCENPWACPHGRPVVIELDREEIEARFERDYPGHGGRSG